MNSNKDIPDEINAAVTSKVSCNHLKPRASSFTPVKTKCDIDCQEIEYRENVPNENETNNK